MQSQPIWKMTIVVAFVLVVAVSIAVIDLVPTRKLLSLIGLLP